MPIELSYLSASVLVYVLMVLIQAGMNFTDHSVQDLAGSRDNVQDKTVKVARAKRAIANMNESMIVFIPLVLIAVIADRTNDMTALGAALFFWGRLAYAPLYLLGIPWLRPLAWGVALIGNILIFLQVLPFT